MGIGLGLFFFYLNLSAVFVDYKFHRRISDLSGIIFVNSQRRGEFSVIYSVGLNYSIRRCKVLVVRTLPINRHGIKNG